VGSSEGKLLFGMEVEFGFAALDEKGVRIEASSALMAYIKMCAKRLLHLPGGDHSKLYLANGSLIYPDCGHPEFATAESPSPVSLLQSLRAGETVMAGIARQLESSAGIGKVILFRTNVDYSQLGTTWGCHESYLSRRRPAEFAPQVVDHLVSRIIYTGAGGFNNQTYGAAFVVSPRAGHLNNKIGSDTTGARSIFSLRDQPLSNAGYHRVHLICGEPNCSELSTYLKVGTTALVLAMADADVNFNDLGGTLRSPVEAMSKFALNPDCRTRAMSPGGNSRSAIDIQRSYLELAEKNLVAAFMPDWAEDVCVKWRSVLEALEDDPESLVGSLDWPTKLAIFKRHLRAHSSLSWDSLAVWSSVATRVSKALATRDDACPRPGSDQLKSRLEVKGAIGRLLTNLTGMLDEHGLDWGELDEFYDLRHQLCELDLRYGQLYPQGIFLELERAGEIRDRIIESARIEAAIDRAPAEGRARVRGDWVRRLATGDGHYSCDWSRIAGEADFIDLGDPFITAADLQVRKKARNLPQDGDDQVLSIPAFLRSREQGGLFD